jgi:predicted site-specific integrase-resolvase
LREKFVERIKDKHGVRVDKWINTKETMHKLGITSKTTLQRYPDEGRIRFSQADRKVIMYDADSILNI